MEYPQDLLTLVKSRISNYKKEHDKDPLPSDSELLRIIETIYHASMHTEEGRQTQTHLIFADPTHFSTAYASLFYKNSYTPIIFKDNKKFTVEEIVKISQATNHKKTLIGIYNSANGVVSDIEIWGIVDIGSRWPDFGTKYMEATPPPNGLRFSCNNPGEVSVLYKTATIAYLKGGRAYTPQLDIFENKAVIDFFRKPLSELQDRISHNLSDGRSIENSSQLLTPCFKGFISRVVRFIQEKKHGGSIIFVPDIDSKNHDLIIKRLKIKYEADASHCQDYIIDYIKSIISYRNLLSDLNKRSGSRHTSDAHKLSHLEREVSELRDKLADTSEFIAGLALIDGAILLTDNLKILGFGVEIMPENSSIINANFTENGTPKSKSIDTYGTRHRPAFRLCSEFNECMVITISQDGDAKIIKNQGDSVWYWKCSEQGGIYL